MNLDIFSNTVGFLGSTTFSLRYITNTRNLRYTWPHNNILARVKNGTGTDDEDAFLRSILLQPVGISRPYQDAGECFELKSILQQFWTKHKKTDYVELLRRCNIEEFNKNLLRPFPKYVVKEYVHRLIYNVIPLSLFGNKSERQIFEQNVRKILYLGKGQVFSLNMLMYRVHTKNKSYLKSLKDNVDKTNLVAKLYLWLLRCYIFAALKCVFYITDSNISKKYVYYKKSVWQKIQQRAFNRMRKQVLETYKNCIITRLVECRNLYVLRILPKRRGSRPIYLKFKREDVGKSKFVIPTVQIVNQFFLQLAKNNSIYSQNVNASIFHDKWETLYFAWASSNRPPVYFVKADFSDAYGSILHEKLLESVDNIIHQNRDKKDFFFSYRKQRKRVTVQYVVGIIKEYVTNFTYKHNNIVYKLTEGISQGGPLSSLLCNFYLGEVDLKYLTEFGNDSSGFLVRNCDDYLYVTLDEEKARTFLNRLTAGFPDYNLRLNNDKTESNITNKTANLVKISSFELDVSSFQIYRCFQLYKNRSIFHTLSFKTTKSPGKIAMKRSRLWATSRLDKVYFNTSYNSVHTTLYNVFQSATLTAARFISYIRVLFQHDNQSFIWKSILGSTTLIASNLTVSKKVHKVSNALLMWIVLKAFSVRLQITREIRDRYAPVLRRIKSTLSTWLTKFSTTEIQLLDTLCCDERIRTLRYIT